MPSRDRPPAKFGPVPPDLDLRRLVEDTPNFRWVDRISCTAIDESGLDAFEKTVNHHVVNKGLPLVVDGWHNKLESWTFSSQWLKDNHGTKFEQARNLIKQDNLALTVAHYLNNMSVLTDQWNHNNYKETNRQRLYLKDIDCPELWHEKLKEQIPSCVFYLNDSTGDVGGPGSEFEKISNGIGERKSRGAAHAGDLMSSLPPGMRAENLMCYIGHEGTFTPAHREMCASLGQNIMVEASGSIDEQGKRTKPGSSIWFMTETSDRQVVSEYWLSMLGHDIEVEKHYAHINAWRGAPFTVYVVEQKVGDLILIPPLAPHQVWNRGTRTMKVAWNRTTVETLMLALDEALPRARLVCRDEQYKNKSIVLFTLNKYYALISKIERMKETTADENARLMLIKSIKLKQLRRDFKRLFHLFNDIVLSESFSPDFPTEKKIEYLPYDSNVTCSYCRCNIFNRFLTCRNCVVPLADGSEDTYDVCLDCFAMGRSCKCVSKLEWVEQFPWRDLVEKHEIWRKMYIQIDGGIKDSSPQPFTYERKFQRERTISEICQYELKRRPFKDPRKAEPESEPSDDSDDMDVTASGAPKKNPKKSKRTEKWNQENLPCHFCCYRHPVWKEAVCITCGTAYCYGTLWRGFDLMPQHIMKDKSWECPRCQNICTCAKCRELPGNRPFEPSGTILGHNTYEYADPRSVESLVDFSVSNRHWIKKTGDGDNPEENRRLQRRQSQALREKEQNSNNDDDEEEEDEDGEGEPEERTLLQAESPDSRPGTSDADIPIDPLLTGGKAAKWADLQSKYNNTHVQAQASKALNAMNGMSLLEQDPEAFMAQAGLGDPREEDPLFMARTAPMRENGYDDASSQQMDGVAFSTPQGNASSKEKGKKRSRKSAVPKVISDAPAQEPDPFAPVATPSAANQRFQLQAEKQRMGQAKKQKLMWSTRAALRGLTANVTLRLSPEKLAQFPAGSSRNLNPEVAPQGDMAEDEPVPIVESNLPKSVPEAEARARNPKVPKKRVREEDLDEDFAAVPSRDRRTQKQQRESRRTAIEDQTEQEISDEDIAESDADENTPARRHANGDGNKRRSLPTYLARREADPEAPLPKELAPPAPSNRNRTEGNRSPGSQLTHRMPIESSATVKAREAQQVEANKQAKQAAFAGSFDSEPEPGADDDDEAAVNSDAGSPPPKKQKIDARVSAPTPSGGSIRGRGGPGGRGSIFSRGGRGKIKVSSARK